MVVRLCWIIYDISDTPLRNRVVSAAKDFGFSRIQKSVFFAVAEERIIQDCTEALRTVMKQCQQNEDSVIVIPLCETCMAKKIVIGKVFNEDMFRDPGFVYFG